MSGRRLREPLNERRAHQRYPVKLPVRFLIRTGKLITIAGEGTTVNISSTGMLFRSSKALNQADRIIAAVQWPATPDGKPMMLLFHGRVIWIKGSQIGMSISHYGFLPEEIPGAEDERRLEEIGSPRRLTPTKTYREVYSSVRQWRRSIQ